jgi:hypothetical protein
MPLEAQAPADFDFVIGDWTVQHHKLKERLNHCAEWLDFGGLSSTSKILGGLGIGLFFANDVLGGVPIKIRFEWTLTRDQHPHWEQAFSPDDGRTWEVNWVMDFTPRDAQAAR